MRPMVAALTALFLVVGCSGLETATSDLKAKIEGFDLNETLDGLSDCDAIADAFLGMVRSGADAIDGLHESTQGSVPISDVREMVDELAVTRYYEIAEQLGCARIQMQLQTVNRLRDLQAGTASGDVFLDQMLEQAQVPSS